MNVLNVQDIERELRKYASRALNPNARRWVLTVARNYLLSDKLPDKDLVANFREVCLCGYTETIQTPDGKKHRHAPDKHDPEELPEWAVKAIERGETLVWFDPVQVRRREIWNVIEVIVLWFNNWKVDDTRWNRVDRIAFPVATNAAILWYKDVSENIWHYVTDKPVVVKEYDHGYRFVKLVTALQFEREGRLMNHCFHGSTRVITSSGTFPINSLTGKTVKLLTRNTDGPGKWVKAHIYNYGQQPVTRILLERNHRQIVITATPEHRWLAFKNRNKNLPIQEFTTSQLKPGYRIPTVFTKNVLFSAGQKRIHLSPIGIAHGIVYGDGHAASLKEGTPNRSAKTTLYGAKDSSLLRWFKHISRTKPVERSVGGIEAVDLPRYFKKLPSKQECTSYLVGWLAGYFAADGCVAADGQPSLSSASWNSIHYVEWLCQKLGIRTTGISVSTRVGLGSQESVLYKLCLEVGTLPAHFFLLKSHRQRAKKRTLKRDHWIVKNVEPTTSIEPVFCAEVPVTKCFTLEGNILTGNCVGNGSYYNRWRANSSSEYYSLRDSHNNPHATLEVSYTNNHPVVRKGSLVQCKGNSNRRPDSKYQPYLRRFIADMKLDIAGDGSMIDS